jgi:hypothetical protein
MQATTVWITGPGEWPFTEISTVWHRPDLSDLGEPYLSAVVATWTVPNRLKGAAVNSEGDAV